MERVNLIINGETFRATLIGRPGIVMDANERYNLTMNKVNIGLGKVSPLQIIGNSELTRAVNRNAGGKITIQYSDCKFELHNCELTENSDLDNDIIWVRFNDARII